VNFRLFGFLAIILSGNAFAIDKDYFSGIKTETAEAVLMSFLSPAYFVVRDGGGELASSVKERNMFASMPYPHASLLFLKERDAILYIRVLQESAPQRFGIKTTNLNRIMVAQYASRGKPVSDDVNKPDFVIVDTLSKSPVLIVDTFVDDMQQPFIYEKNGKKFIPAFLTHDIAIAFEPTVNAAGRGKYSRRGIDFRSHLLFVERYVKSDTPVITFGEDAQKLMDYYISNIAK